MLPIRSPRDPEGTSAPVRWLRVLKLLLTVILLAIAVWRAVAGVLPW